MYTNVKDAKSVPGIFIAAYFVIELFFIGTPIDDYVANSIIAQLLFLQMEDPKKDIHVYINSPGAVSQTAWQFMTPFTFSNAML